MYTVLLRWRLDFTVGYRHSGANLTRSRTLAASMLGSSGGAGTLPPKEHVRADTLVTPTTSS